jgi:hypothetical protein
LGSRLFLIAFLAIVLAVDTVLNIALIERLADVGQSLALVSSIGVSLLLLAVSHLTVASTPPGSRAAVRRRLAILMWLGLATLVLGGGYLRNHSTRSTGAGGSLGLGGAADSSSPWTDLIGPAAGYLAMVALMATTFAAAALAGLHHEQLKQELRHDDDGTTARRFTEMQASVDWQAACARQAVQDLGSQLQAVYVTSFRAALPADVADRV